MTKKFAETLLFVCCVLFLFIRLSQFTQQCDGSMPNSRMSSNIISTPLVFTILQCEDECFRNDSCDGFNFKQSLIHSQHSTCELVQSSAGQKISNVTGYSFKLINRENIKDKWLGKSCSGCSERQECKRQIDSCNKNLCQCKKGYLDDGNGTCNFVACTDNALLQSDEENITMPTFLKKECTANQNLIFNDFTCYYKISFATKKNFLLNFKELDLSGNKDACSISNQYIDVMSDDGTIKRFCGNIINNSTSLTGTNIYLKFYSKAFTNTCVKVVGNYRVLD